MSTHLDYSSMVVQTLKMFDKKKEVTMLINNRFSWDDDGSRLERVLLLSQNIDTHAAELGVVGDHLTLSQTAGADAFHAKLN